MPLRFTRARPAASPIAPRCAGKKNGAKILRSLVKKTKLWQDVARRQALKAEAAEAGLQRVVDACTGGNVTMLRKVRHNSAPRNDLASPEPALPGIYILTKGVPTAAERALLHQQQVVRPPCPSADVGSPLGTALAAVAPGASPLNSPSLKNRRSLRSNIWKRSSRAATAAGRPGGGRARREASVTTSEEEDGSDVCSRDGEDSSHGSPKPPPRTIGTRRARAAAEAAAAAAGAAGGADEEMAAPEAAAAAAAPAPQPRAEAKGAAPRRQAGPAVPPGNPQAPAAPAAPLPHRAEIERTGLSPTAPETPTLVRCPSLPRAPAPFVHRLPTSSITGGPPRHSTRASPRRLAARRARASPRNRPALARRARRCRPRKPISTERASPERSHVTVTSCAVSVRCPPQIVAIRQNFLPRLDDINAHIVELTMARATE